MSMKERIKKLLIAIKLKINQIPLLRSLVISLLSMLPSFYSRLQNLKPESQHLEETKVEIKLSSQKAKDVFSDIKKQINQQVG